MPFDQAGNRFGDARKITLNDNKGRIKDWIGASDQDDYFKFRLKHSSTVKFKLSNLSSDADLELLDKGGNRIDFSSCSGQKRECIKQQNLEAGKYYLRVYQSQGNTNYKLKFKGVSDNSADKPNQGIFSGIHPFIQKVLDLTNLQRSRFGLNPLTLNADLNRAAQTHSESMALDDFFSHTGADGSSPFDRIRATGYTYSTAAENIAAGYSTPETVVEGWMNSPGHRANILNSDLQEMGIGYYFLENDTGSVTHNSYWTQAFGTPFQ